MHRVVEGEQLDELAPADPVALRSRRDLRRINAWMANARIMAGALRESFPGPPRAIAELGAGDGTLMLRIARRLGGAWQNVKTTLVDRQDVFDRTAMMRLQELGWPVRLVVADAMDWLATRKLDPDAVVVANLFLHHFSNKSLVNLFENASIKARCLIAVEPRRSPLALCFARLLWLIGANAVTRHDAVLSVRAGFVGADLSSLWPADGGWQLEERQAGWCSHLFIARRRN